MDQIDQNLDRIKSALRRKYYSAPAPSATSVPVPSELPKISMVLPPAADKPEFAPLISSSAYDYDDTVSLSSDIIVPATNLPPSPAAPPVAKYLPKTRKQMSFREIVFRLFGFSKK